MREGERQRGKVLIQKKEDQLLGRYFAVRGKGGRTWKPLIEAGPLSLLLHEVRGTQQGGWGGEGRRFKERRSELVILESEKVSDSGLPGSQGAFLRRLAKHF